MKRQRQQLCVWKPTLMRETSAKLAEDSVASGPWVLGPGIWASCSRSLLFVFQMHFVLSPNGQWEALLSSLEQPLGLLRPPGGRVRIHLRRKGVWQECRRVNAQGIAWLFSFAQAMCHDSRPHPWVGRSTFTCCSHCLVPCRPGRHTTQLVCFLI